MSGFTIGSQRYSTSYSAECALRCGFMVPPQNRRVVVLDAVQQHVRDTGHETALVWTTSRHYFKRRVADG